MLDYQVGPDWDKIYIQDDSDLTEKLCHLGGAWQRAAQSWHAVFSNVLTSARGFHSYLRCLLSRQDVYVVGGSSRGNSCTSSTWDTW